MSLNKETKPTILRWNTSVWNVMFIILMIILIYHQLQNSSFKLETESFILLNLKTVDKFLWSTDYE